MRQMYLLILFQELVQVVLSARLLQMAMNRKRYLRFSRHQAFISLSEFYLEERDYY